jgi:hypothetical protein
MDLTEEKNLSITKLTTFQLSQSSEGILLNQKSASSSFIAKSLLKLFILRSKLSALRFAYAQQSYHNRYRPSEKETRTE